MPLSVLGSNDQVIFLIFSIGFTCNRSNSSLFIFVTCASMFYLLVYVDDFILTKNTSELLVSFIFRFSQEFAIKDLDKFSYLCAFKLLIHMMDYFLIKLSMPRIFCTVQILRMLNLSLHLQQLVFNYTLMDLFDDLTVYRSLVRVLQYLIFTRLDLSFIVNLVSQFLQQLTIEHFHAVKDILRYVKSTLYL